MSSKFATAVKSSSGKVAGAFKTKPNSPTDSLSLATKTPPPGADLFVSMAQMHERNGNFDEAERQYQRALKAEPDNLPAMLAYAHLHDRQDNWETAIKLYKQAVAKHPNNGGAHNDLGLCYHRRGMLPDAEQSLRMAVKLAPDRKLFRNNLAAVLVEQNKSPEAFAMLKAAHGDAGAHYNLGCLEYRKGNQLAAVDHFRQAAAIDPSLTPAHQWLARLTPPAAGPQAQPYYVAQTSPVGPTNVQPSPDVMRKAFPNYVPSAPPTPAARLPIQQPMPIAAQMPPAAPQASPAAPQAPTYVAMNNAPPQRPPTPHVLRASNPEEVRPAEEPKPAIRAFAMRYPSEDGAAEPVVQRTAPKEPIPAARAPIEVADSEADAMPPLPEDLRQ